MGVTWCEEALAWRIAALGQTLHWSEHRKSPLKHFDTKSPKTWLAPSAIEADGRWPIFLSRHAIFSYNGQNVSRSNSVKAHPGSLKITPFLVWLTIHSEPTDVLRGESTVCGLNGHRLYYIISLLKATYKSTIRVHAIFTHFLQRPSRIPILAIDARLCLFRSRADEAESRPSSEQGLASAVNLGGASSKRAIPCLRVVPWMRLSATWLSH